MAQEQENLKVELNESELDGVAGGVRAPVGGPNAGNFNSGSSSNTTRGPISGMGSGAAADPFSTSGNTENQPKGDPKERQTGHY
jgi:hypothetical protein